MITSNDYFGFKIISWKRNWNSKNLLRFNQQLKLAKVASVSSTTISRCHFVWRCFSSSLTSGARLVMQMSPREFFLLFILHPKLIKLTRIWWFHTRDGASNDITSLASARLSHERIAKNKENPLIIRRRLLLAVSQLDGKYHFGSPTAGDSKISRLAKRNYPAAETTFSVDINWKKRGECDKNIQFRVQLLALIERPLPTEYKLNSKPICKRGKGNERKNVVIVIIPSDSSRRRFSYLNLCANDKSAGRVDNGRADAGQATVFVIPIPVKPNTTASPTRRFVDCRVSREFH